MDDRNKKKIGIVFIVVLICCFLYFGAKGTYTAFESLVGGDVSSRVAQFNLLVNGIDIKNENIHIDDVEWTSTHTREDKLSPGSCGYFLLNLDPRQSDVAILYTFQFTDKSVDESKLILFDSITSNNSTIVKTGINEYSGIITRSDVISGLQPVVRVEFCYPDEGDQEPITEDNGDLDDFFEIDFTAYQYLGETLTPYSEEE